ncbi:MAG TPA: DUF6496 domain-containing protein [Candidatus Angelobacter sp.]|nr:DUF6496 domain-containing protein [Candidatus Angelobacter sp.]
MAAKKSGSSSKSSSRKKSSSSKKKSSGRKYSKKAGQEVRTEMHHMRSGKHKVKNRKQAIAIGLSKARQKGAKVPRKSSSRKKAA